MATGGRPRSFCYVSDLVEGLVRLMESDVSEPVNLGNPVEITILAAAQEVIRLIGSRSPIIHTARPPDDPCLRRPDIGPRANPAGLGAGCGATGRVRTDNRVVSDDTAEVASLFDPRGAKRPRFPLRLSPDASLRGRTRGAAANTRYYCW